jgi:hypothetical protein
MRSSCLGDIDVVIRIILKFNLKNDIVRMGTEFTNLRIETTNGLLRKR